MNHNTTAASSSGDVLTRPVWPFVLVSIDVALFVASAVAGFISAGKSAADITAELKESETIMEDTTATSTTVDPTKKKLPMASKAELQRPPIAFPTIALLVMTCSLYTGSFFGYVFDYTNWSTTIVLSTIAVYWSFTVLHDAVHIAVSPKYKWLNEVCGTLAGLPLFAPMPFFRYIHLNHHRYTGDEELDPDAYAGRGPQILLPIKWFTNLYFYIYYFARTMRLRASSGMSEATRRKDLRLALISMTMPPTVFIVLNGLYFLMPIEKSAAPIFGILIPQHLAAMLLIYLFDYIPHRPHKIHYKDDPFMSTNATSFLGCVDGFLWTSVTLSQNLHVIHHIWPFMPFYTYKSLWEAHGKECIEKGTRVVPLLVTSKMADVFKELKDDRPKLE